MRIKRFVQISGFVIGVQAALACAVFAAEKGSVVAHGDHRYQEHLREMGRNHDPHAEIQTATIG